MEATADPEVVAVQPCTKSLSEVAGIISRAACCVAVSLAVPGSLGQRR
ncbi:MAG: hypothetical protein U0326_17060 [Polyangiales bacterium]